MPATRSRTNNWRRSLEQIYERNGALEITLPRYFEGQGGEAGEESGSNLIWRVRVLDLSNDEIVVEEPMALGTVLRLRDGIDLIGIIVVGQNRWMFKSTNLGRTTISLNGRTEVGALRLRMPRHVERCQRRNFYRISTIGLQLPQVMCYPLLDPASATIAETANRLQFADVQDAQIVLPPAGLVFEDRDRLPQVGPGFATTLVNLGGGGVGLLAEGGDRTAFDSHRVYWLLISLAPQLPVPLGVVGRLRHTHIDSEQRLYAGMAFDFGHNPPHERFVVDQLCRYVAEVQREQLRRCADE